MAGEGSGSRIIIMEGNAVLDVVGQWPGVSLHRGSRGELSVRVGRVEIGHMHGTSVAHFGFPKPQLAELMQEGRVERHPVNVPGWAARRIRTPADVNDVVELFRLNYERVRERVARREQDGE